jgi:hypothetical protein
MKLYSLLQVSTTWLKYLVLLYTCTLYDFTQQNVLYYISEVTNTVIKKQDR